MIATAPERNWLFDPNRLKLVHQCRRLIHSEFGIKLHLTDEQLPQQLADYAEKSRSSQLARVWNALKVQIPGYTEGEGLGTRRVYRGQVISDEPPARSADREHPLAGAPATKKKIIYRGQVVG